MLPRSKQAVKAEHPTMQAVAIRNGALVYGAQPMPAPKPDEVLLKVRFAGINRADLLQVEGKYAAPAGASELPGLEVSGTIAAVGDKVIGWSVGEEVCALLSGGGYAEYVAVPAGQILSLPARITLKEAASLPEAVATAYMALGMEAGLKKGERVLLHGGTSGVGIIMAQVARAWGAEVYATAGSGAKCAMLEKLGIHAINHAKAPFAETLKSMTDGVDVIIDTLGGPQLNTHLELLNKGGRLVSLALMEGALAESLKMGRILMKHLTISGATLRSRTAEEKAAIIAGVHKTIWPLVSAGAIRPFTDQVFLLEDAEKAHQRMQERLHIGKILLEVATERGD